jgi:hypothetical protein
MTRHNENISYYRCLLKSCYQYNNTPCLLKNLGPPGPAAPANAAIAKKKKIDALNTAINVKSWNLRFGLNKPRPDENKELKCTILKIHKETYTGLAVCRSAPQHD